jgi:hypothetical protein
MEVSDEIRQEATRYLLGAATADEQMALEEKYFSDPGLFEQVVAIEKELLDDYARDRLSAHERELFERHYLSHPKRRARAKTALALALKLKQSKPLKTETKISSWLRDLLAAIRTQSFAFGMTVAALLLALGGAWLVRETNRLRTELSQSQIAQATIEQRELELQALLREQQGRNEQLSTELEKLRAAQQETPTTTPPSLVSLLLMGGLAREGSQAETPRLFIPAGTERVRLQLKLKDDDYRRYRLSLETADGRAIRTLENLKPDPAKIFTMTIPSRLFTNGEYVLALSGVNDNGEIDSLSKSLFRVESKVRNAPK